MKEIEYKDYYITVGFYGQFDVTVQFEGDDVFFNTVEEAKKFIDNL